MAEEIKPFRWIGPLCVSRRADMYAVIVGEVEFTCGIYSQKQILIEALEKWLSTFEEHV